MLKTVSSLGNFANVTITSTDPGAAAGPLLELYRDSASPAANDTLGEIEFNGEDSAGNKQAYALFHASILSPTSGAEQGQLHFETATGGALTEKMIIGTTNLVINEIGAIYNVRIEGDTDANLFFTDATNSRVGVGTITPAAKLDVVGGDARIDNGNLIPATAAKGVNFTANTPAASMTSQLLNWYEEGTCTINGALTTPGTSATSFTFGQYVRVGRLVTVNFFISFEKGTGSGTFTLTGLPFASASNSIRTPMTLRCDGIGAALTVLQSDVASASTVINLILANQSQVNGSAVTDVSMAATIFLSGSLTYQV